MQKQVVVFTGGGTGGHIYPNLALIPDFEKRGFSAVYIGADGDSQERRLAKSHEIPYYAVPTVKFSRAHNLSGLKNNLKIPSTLKAGIKEAKSILKKISPALVFSKGGFVSLPVVIAASKLNIPVFAHESDATLGLANRIAKFYGANILKGNPAAEFEGKFVGIPLRHELFSAEKQIALTKLGVEQANTGAKRILLIIGGSSGAQVFNDFVLDNLSALTKKFFVLHITGRGKCKPPKHADYLATDHNDGPGVAPA